MTWSVSAQGHHSSDDWKEEEYLLLAAFVKATDVENTVVSGFSFNGNHVQASSLEDAKAKLQMREEGEEE
jgi:hypothetical protein